MLWIYLVVLQILFFAGLLYFLRFVLTRNISKATGHLHDLSKDYATKEEEANQMLENARKEAKSIAANEMQATEEVKEKMLQEAQAQQDRIVKEANLKSNEITEKAEQNAEFLRSEIDQKIDARANEKVHTLLQEVIPKQFLEDVHEQWMIEADKGDFNLKNLKLSENVKEAEIISAFALSDKQKEDLKKKLKKKIGNNTAVKVSVDASLISGFIITIGGVVVDASLKHKIQKAMQE